MDDQEFIWTCVGHVVGMCQLRDYLAGTSGERIMEFWKDAERFHRLPVQNTRMRRALFREIQLRYFEIGGITKLKDNRMWKVIEGECHGQINPTLNDISYISWHYGKYSLDIEFYCYSDLSICTEYEPCTPYQQFAALMLYQIVRLGQ